MIQSMNDSLSAYDCFLNFVWGIWKEVQYVWPNFQINDVKRRLIIGLSPPLTAAFHGMIVMKRSVSHENTVINLMGKIR